MKTEAVWCIILNSVFGHAVKFKLQMMQVQTSVSVLILILTLLISDWCMKKVISPFSC